MALGNVSIIDQNGQMLPASRPWPVAAAATAIYAGEPCKLVSTYAVPSADAEPGTGTPTFLGIAASNSTQTASVDGTVSIYTPVPGLVYACKAKSAATIDTAAELQALIGVPVLFDLTSSQYTVDTGATASTSGLVIVGGDIVNGIVYFMVRSSVALGIA